METARLGPPNVARARRLQRKRLTNLDSRFTDSVVVPLLHSAFCHPRGHLSSPAMLSSLCPSALSMWRQPPQLFPARPSPVRLRSWPVANSCSKSPVLLFLFLPVPGARPFQNSRSNRGVASLVCESPGLLLHH